MGNTTNERSKDFLVSTADVAFIVNGMLAFTGTTSLNTSISVSMEDQEITGGKGGKTLYKYKYGRKLSPSIEMADWNLAYIAANVGSSIFEGLKDVFTVAECVTLTKGVGTLKKVPVGKVFIEKADGTTVDVTPTGSVITVGEMDGTILATYQYNTNIKRITIDAESTPMIGELILTADKHNNKKGKVGEVQIDIPSFQLSGAFDISLEAGGNTTTTLNGDALAVSGSSCSDGSVYAYISEIPSIESTITVSDIAATPAVITLNVNDTQSLTIVGLKGGLYSNISIDSNDCTITSDDSTIATVSSGIITGIQTGTTFINIDYNGIKDVVKVVVS
ncbi:MAG: hypothetical protein HFH73_03490 [Lachnospiraceae bacterium]|jgi:hypothetical protein|nr:hypothetical protein [Lachnospiraceae bacterium]